MTQVIALQSFKAGTGKTTLAINLAALLAQEGARVALVDTNFELSGLPLALGLPEVLCTPTLWDYVQANAPAYTAPRSVAPYVRLATNCAGELYFIPAGRSHPPHTTIPEAELNRVLDELCQALQLDVLIIDTPAGVHPLHTPTLFVAQILLLVLHLESQEFQGISVLQEVAQRLNIPHVGLIANEVPQTFDLNQVRNQLRHSYQLNFVEALPYESQLMGVANQGIFVLRYPYHQITQQLQRLVKTIRNLT